MAKIMWRYSNDARAIIENVNKFCMEENASGMKLSLAHVWDRTTALTGVSKSTAEKVIQEKKKQQEQPQPQPQQSTVSKEDQGADKGGNGKYNGSAQDALHVKRVEQKYCDSDIARDEMPDSIVISLDARDDESATDTANEDEDEP